MISDTHDRLREATRPAHEQLETRLQILDRVATPEGRRQMVAQFHRLHSDLETALSPWLTGLSGLDFSQRRRTRMLEADMAALGALIVPRDVALIAVAGVPEALGLMYVLEGSTLGGRVIRRELAKRGEDMRGLSFLDPYGEEVGARWKAFMAVVDTAVRTPADSDAVVAGALAGFRHAELRLCEAAVDA